VSDSAPASFSDLDALRNHLNVLAERHVATLGYYYDDRFSGFHHKHDRPDRPNVPISSTSTCILSLIQAGKWNAPHAPWNGRSSAIVTALLQRKEWKSGGLKPNNVFTVAFILEATTALKPYAVSLGADDAAKEEKAQTILLRAITPPRRGSQADYSGGIGLEDYPPSAYVTQLVSRVLRTRSPLDVPTRHSVATWAWREIEHQLALSTAQSKNFDVFQPVYSVLLAADIGDLEEATPDQNLVLNAALDQFFRSQLANGTWPRSRPLFHYPGVGNAYCFEYEMLAQLLQTTKLRDRLLHYLPRLSKAAFALAETAYPVGKEGLGWSSGHHPQLPGPESWSTASVYHFIHGLGRLVAEAIRKAVFNDLGAPYSPPADAKMEYSDFAPELLDCPMDHRSAGVITGQDGSLRNVLYYHFVKPIAEASGRVEAGASMPRDTATAAIFFGPPGTSKTALADEIAGFLRWPKLTVDPSYFVREGMDRIQAQAEKLFNMLSSSERIVVLLDEFDEMVLDRAGSNEVLSRFLTTSMLPKLAKVNKSRRIVFLVATNHIENFDLAITRSGRFDLIVPIMPPTLEEKLKTWPDVQQKLEQVGLSREEGVRAKLAKLTYDEFRSLAPRICRAEERDAVRQLIEKLQCTLERKIDGDREESRETGRITWEQACKAQASERVRIPDIPIGAAQAEAPADPRGVEDAN
jgi:ATPase family associated with various cellular activities (AAA)